MSPNSKWKMSDEATRGMLSSNAYIIKEWPAEYAEKSWTNDSIWLFSICHTHWYSIYMCITGNEYINTHSVSIKTSRVPHARTHQHVCCMSMYVCRLYLPSVWYLYRYIRVSHPRKALFDWIPYFSNRMTNDECRIGGIVNLANLGSRDHTAATIAINQRLYRPRSQLSCLLFRSLFVFSYCLLWLAFWRHSLEPSWTIWRTVQTGCEWIEKLRYKWRPTS